MELAHLTGETRSAGGSRAAARLRQLGKVPGIVYGHGEDPIAVAVPQHDLELLLHHGTLLMELELNGNRQRVLVKEVQYDHLGTTPIHVDLARVRLDERVRVTVPVELRGTPKGVKEGGVLDQVIADLEVECLVTEIPERLRVDISEMALGSTLKIGEIPLPEGVKVMASPELVVCTVRQPVEEEEAAAPAAAAEGAAAAEPEVIRKERAEAEEEAEEKPKEKEKEKK
jgi:large subunit ribosomal protein L25